MYARRVIYACDWVNCSAHMKVGLSVVLLVLASCIASAYARELLIEVSYVILAAACSIA